MADGFNELLHAIEQAPRETERFLRTAVEVSARNIKDQIRADYSGARQLPGASASIAYEMHQGLNEISAEIGPRLGGQGSIVGLADKGTVNNAGRNRIPKALEDETDGFARGVRQAVQDGLSAAGL